jgi:hypothetical protein
MAAIKREPLLRPGSKVLKPVRPKTPTLLCGQQPRASDFQDQGFSGPEKKGFWGQTNSHFLRVHQTRNLA